MTASVLVVPIDGALPAPLSPFIVRHYPGKRVGHLVDTRRDAWEVVAICGARPEFDAAFWCEALWICRRCAKRAGWVGK